MTGDYGRRHFVHVYAVIRVKVAVDAPDHRRAMEAADELLFAGGPPVRLVAMSSAVLDADHADEVFGYLVDEADDPEFERSRAYGPDHEPEGKTLMQSETTPSEASLDQADTEFRESPTRESAGTLLTVATRYWNDDMIGDGTYSGVVLRVRDWLFEKAEPVDTDSPGPIADVVHRIATFADGRTRINVCRAAVNKLEQRGGTRGKNSGAEVKRP
ncbi:hypothetical protein GGR43_004352 [Sphingobium jiangsuense]|uniref:Uncharacterized protein n=1 Tax=Sphingobium jiangsuense TaxID=870476 RepID=A0A7W6BNV8_9SPHN|nr:hypothetical protein [Sphingobium jiangsuense]MBB3928607.1 hypothetical protein [Sphingobium jiangsuense]